MKYKVGIYGSATGDMQDVMPKALELGKVLRNYKDEVILITGACPGMPYAVVSEAAKSKIEVWGFSSTLNEKTQRVEYPDDDLSAYKKMIYVPADFPGADNERVCKKYRNVVSTSNCDAGIIISGRWGSLNEFTNLIDMRKVVGVYTETGGIADELPALSKKNLKPTKAK